jgi:hypothetical protein
MQTGSSSSSASRTFSGPTPRPSLISMVMARDTTSRDARSLAVGAYLHTHASRNNSCCAIAVGCYMLCATSYRGAASQNEHKLAKHQLDQCNQLPSLTAAR